LVSVPKELPTCCSLLKTAFALLALMKYTITAMMMVTPTTDLIVILAITTPLRYEVVD
jgi:hypothetical protein